MNIFAVHPNPKISARQLCDQHVVKMALESAQLLCNVRHGQHLPAPYRPFNPQHPCSIWAGESLENYEWLLDHALELCHEFERRFGKIHGCQKPIEFCSSHRGQLRFSHVGQTDFRQCMPQIYQCEGDAIQAYQNYYRGEKLRFARWNYSAKPEWIKKDRQQKCRSAIANSLEDRNEATLRRAKNYLAG